MLLLLLLLLPIFLAIFIEIWDFVALDFFLVRLPRAFLNDCHVLRRFDLHWRWHVMHVRNDVVLNITIGDGRARWLRVSKLGLGRDIWGIWVGVCQRVQINAFTLHFHVTVLEVLKVMRNRRLVLRRVHVLVDLMIVVDDVIVDRRLNAWAVLFRFSSRWVKIKWCFTPGKKFQVKI